MRWIFGGRYRAAAEDDRKSASRLARPKSGPETVDGRSARFRDEAFEFDPVPSGWRRRQCSPGLN